MQPRQIILVDDEPRLLAALRRRLSSTFDVLTFERGQEALDYLAKPNNVAVIVADMQMPEMNGIELLKKVQISNPDIRRLMLSGNSDQETAIAAINEGKVLRFIRKPCDAMVLKDFIEEALEEYEFNKADLSTIKAEPELESKDRLEQTQQTFLSIMSDELRTPLSQIITISKILTKNRSQTDEETLEKFLKQISESGETALSHIDRILRYTHLQSSECREEDKENIDIVTLFRNEISTAETRAKDKLVTVSMESLRKKAYIKAMPSDISCAVREVIQNAIKYSHIGGHISVIFRFDKDNIAIRIANNGATDNNDDHLRPNSPFKHAEEGLDGESSGVGLGLSLVNLISGRNDGVFNLQEKGNGTSVATFVFKRPKIEADAQDGQEDSVLKLAS